MTIRADIADRSGVPVPDRRLRVEVRPVESDDFRKALIVTMDTPMYGEPWDVAVSVSEQLRHDINVDVAVLDKPEDAVANRAISDTVTTSIRSDTFNGRHMLSVRMAVSVYAIGTCAAIKQLLTTTVADRMLENFCVL